MSVRLVDTLVRQLFWISMEKILLLVLTALSIFITFEMARWLGLVNRCSQREIEKLIGIDRGSVSPPDSPNSGRQLIIAQAKWILVLLFVMAVCVSGTLIVATFKSLLA